MSQEVAYRVVCCAALPPRYVPADSPDSDDAPQLALQPELGLAERLALGSADDIEAGLRRIHEWRPLPAETRRGAAFCGRPLRRGTRIPPRVKEIGCVI
jgi:hypothetical protein